MPQRSLPIVVCPLAFEARLLRRAGLAAQCEVRCSGPGAGAMRRWAEGLTPGGPVILSGLAGSLREPFAAGSAYVASAILDEDGGRLEPTFGTGAGGAVVSSAPHTLATSSAKRQWSEGSGADLVDLESVAFARAAEARGWHWSVVRGVSDGPETSLPPDIDDWVDGRGRARAVSVLRALAARRVRLGALKRLRDDSVAAMRSAAELIRSMLASDLTPDP